MSEFAFNREQAIEAIDKSKINGLDWLYDNYPKPGGKRRKSRSGFLVYEGSAFPVKPLGRFANEIAKHPMVGNPQTRFFSAHFRKLGFQLIDSFKEEADAAADRQRRLAETWLRPRQARFRRQVFSIYGAQCIVTGCGSLEALEAAHIVPVHKGGDESSWNGIPLRADIHRLFDAGLITFERGTLKLKVSNLHREDYGVYDGLDLEPAISATGQKSKIKAAIRDRIASGF